jgi:hypothetical protein
MDMKKNVIYHLRYAIFAKVQNMGFPPVGNQRTLNAHEF